MLFEAGVTVTVGVVGFFVLPPPPLLLPHPPNKRPTTETEHMTSNFAARFISYPFVPFVPIEFKPLNPSGTQARLHELASGILHANAFISEIVKPASRPQPASFRSSPLYALNPTQINRFIDPTRRPGNLLFCPELQQYS
jgi:hypothetical protein